MRLLELKYPVALLIERIRETIETNLDSQFLLDYDAVCKANFDQVGFNLYESLNSLALKNLLVERLFKKQLPEIEPKITLEEVDNLLSVFNQLDDDPIRDSFCKKFKYQLLSFISQLVSYIFSLSLRYKMRKRAAELTFRVLALAPDMEKIYNNCYVKMGDNLSWCVIDKCWDASELNQRFDELPESKIKDVVRKMYEDDFKRRRGKLPG